MQRTIAIELGLLCWKNIVKPVYHNSSEKQLCAKIHTFFAGSSGSHPGFLWPACCATISTVTEVQHKNLNSCKKLRIYAKQSVMNVKPGRVPFTLSAVSGPETDQAAGA